MSSPSYIDYEEMMLKIIKYCDFTANRDMRQYETETLD